MYIRCRGNVFTKSLPSNDRGIHIQTHRLMGGIYEIRRWDGLRCHDIYTKFHKDWLRPSKVDMGGYMGIQEAWWSLKPTFTFFEIRKVGYYYENMLGIMFPSCFTCVQNLVSRSQKWIQTEGTPICKRMLRRIEWKQKEGDKHHKTRSCIICWRWWMFQIQHFLNCISSPKMSKISYIYS
jgi:hypothetical protein